MVQILNEQELKDMGFTIATYNATSSVSDNYYSPTTTEIVYSSSNSYVAPEYTNISAFQTICSWPYTLTYPSIPNYTLAVKVVTNGFIVDFNNEQYVFNEVNELNKFIKQSVKKDKK